MPAIVSERSKAHILIVDDDPTTAANIADLLTMSGFHASIAETGSAAKAKFVERCPDLVILELMLPDVDGLVLCAELSRRGATVLVCSATNRQRDPILARRLGAEDFIAKPFDLAEFEARVEAILRATNHVTPTSKPEFFVEDDQDLRVGTLLLNRARRHVTVGEQELPTTGMQYRLLRALVSHPNEVIPRKELAQSCWGFEVLGSSRSIDVQIHRLKVKLASLGLRGAEIVAVRGEGYKIVSHLRTAAAA